MGVNIQNCQVLCVRLICANVIGVEVLIAPDVQPSAANDWMCKVGVGWLSFQLEPADYVEPDTVK